MNNAIDRLCYAIIIRRRRLSHTRIGMWMLARAGRYAFAPEESGRVASDS